MSKKLTPKQQDFRTAYIRSKTKNATEAARAAGYKHPNKRGPELLKQPAIAAAIDAHQAVALSHADIDQDYVLGRIKECVEYCLAPGRMDVNGVAPHLKMLGQYLKLFTDRIEIQSTQIEKLLGEVISVLKRTLPHDLWPKVADELARVSDTYGLGDNDAGNS